MKDLEKSLKRFLKRKIKLTTAVVVSFLITGAIGYATEQELIPKSEDTEVLLFLNGMFSKLENDKIKDINNFKLGEDQIKPPTTQNKPNIPWEDLQPSKPIQPDKPVEPEKPSVPWEDLQPSKPIQPDKPVEPEKPSIPWEDLQPSKPIQPDKPSTPLVPLQPATKVNTENKVQENGIIFDIKKGETFTNKGNLTLKSDVELVDKDKD